MAISNDAASLWSRRWGASALERVTVSAAPRTSNHHDPDASPSSISSTKCHGGQAASCMSARHSSGTYRS